MKKITLSFLNSTSPIPIVRFPLSNGRSIYAIIDTGSDSTVYDKAAKEVYPELFIKTKHVGKQRIIGVSETKEMDIFMSGMRLQINQEAQEDLTLKLCAFEHSDFGDIVKPLAEQEGLNDSIPLLIGSDTLIRYNVKIDMKKRTISFCLPKIAA